MARKGDYTYKYATHINRQSTIGLWHFNNNLTAAVGSNFGGIGTITYPTGKFGDGMNNTTFGGCYTNTSIPLTNLPTTTYTVEGWAYKPSGGGYQQWFTAKPAINFGGTTEWYLGVNGDGEFNIFINGASYLDTTGYLDQWIHWAVVFETETNIRFYINGLLVDTASEVLIQDVLSFGIGASQMRVDETRVSNTVLYSGSTYTIPTQEFDTISKYFEDRYVTYEETGANSGVLYGGGGNSRGMLAQGDTAIKSTPVVIGSLGDQWKSFASETSTNTFGSIAAIKNNGTLWTCGYNNDGQIGNGTSGNEYSSLVQVGSDTDWKVVKKGYFSAVAQKLDGTIYTFGRPQGMGAYFSTPVQYGTHNDWKDFALMKQGICTMYIKAAGTLWGVGNNVANCLGTGITGVNNNEQVGSDSDWIDMDMGDSFTMALKSNGTLWGWGDNINGQLGVGDVVQKSTPVQVGSDTDWAKIATGYYASYALKTDGTLWSWGRNNGGALGQGISVIVKLSSPQQVGALTDWVEVRAGTDYAFAKKTDGTWWSWGEASSHQQAKGSNADTSTPVQHPSTDDWKDIWAGNYGMLGIS